MYRVCVVAHAARSLNGNGRPQRCAMERNGRDAVSVLVGPSDGGWRGSEFFVWETTIRVSELAVGENVFDVCKTFKRKTGVRRPKVTRLTIIDWFQGSNLTFSRKISFSKTVEKSTVTKRFIWRCPPYREKWKKTYAQPSNILFSFENSR